MTTHVALFRTEEGRKMVSDKCKAADVDMSILEKLIEVEHDQVGKVKKRGLWDSFDEILSLDENDDED